jgi:hypothetical protein
MDSLDLFGLVAVSLMLAFYALEERSPWFILAFASACSMGSLYGFLQGAWPFGRVEGVWTFVAARRRWVARRAVLASHGPVTDGLLMRPQSRHRGSYSEIRSR